MKTLTHASLFSGIGRAEIAARWSGWRNAFHCEINPFCRKVLDYHFPESESYEDITKTDFRKWRGRIDVLTAGFPCQPFSVAGQRRGADDNRYLWPEVVRAVREIRPAWVVGENVAGILTMVQPGEEVEVGSQSSLFGEADRKRVLHRQEYVVETICRDLEREGYSVWPLVIPACAVGAPHRRDRVWFIAKRIVADCPDTGIETMQQEREDGVLFGGIAADTNSNRRRKREDKQEPIAQCERTSDNSPCREDGTVTHPDGERCDNGGGDRSGRPVCDERKRNPTEGNTERDEREHRAGKDGEAAANTQCVRGGKVHNEIQSEQLDGERTDGNGGERASSHTNGIMQERRLRQTEKRRDETGIGTEPLLCIKDWSDFPTTQPAVRRGDDGLPFDVDSLTIPFTKWRQEAVKAYGNAWVPQVAYEIFRAINETYNDKRYET